MVISQTESILLRGGRNMCPRRLSPSPQPVKKGAMSYRYILPPLACRVHMFCSSRFLPVSNRLAAACPNALPFLCTYTYGMWEFDVWTPFVRYLSLGTFRKLVLYVHTFRTLYNSSTGSFMACLSYTPVNEKFNFRPKVSLTIMGKKILGEKGVFHCLRQIQNRVLCYNIIFTFIQNLFDYCTLTS